MEFIPIKTKKITSNNKGLHNFLDTYITSLKEEDILIITSKVLSIFQNRFIDLKDYEKKEKRRKIQSKEADYIGPKASNKIPLIKNNILSYGAGIDRSNVKEGALALPKNPNNLAKDINLYLKKNFKLKKLGVIIIDSYSPILRLGIVDISIGFFGLNPLYHYKDKKDLFGRKFKHSRVNVIDSLAATAGYIIGQGQEKTPLLIIRGLKKIKFSNKNYSKDFYINLKKDRFSFLFEKFKKN